MKTERRALHFSVTERSALLLLFALILLTSCREPSHASIEGRWRSLKTTKGGIGEVLEFRSDGTVDYSLGAVVEMPWHIENNQLALPPETVGGTEQKYTLEWLGDNKLRLKAEGSITEFARVGERPKPDNPIVGEWIESREMAGRKLQAHWLVYPGGKLLLVMPFAIQHGSYAISGSALHVKIPGYNPELRFKLADNILTLSAQKTPQGAQESRYARY